MHVEVAIADSWNALPMVCKPKLEHNLLNKRRFIISLHSIGDLQENV
jgi:hypothetical protein